MIFVRRKKKFVYFFGSLYRCKIFWRIHFSHPRSDLTSISQLNRGLAEKNSLKSQNPPKSDNFSQKLLYNKAANHCSQIFIFVDFGPIFSEVGGFDEEQKSGKSRFETTIYSLNISKSSHRKTVSIELGDLMDGFESNFKFQRPRTRPRRDIVSDVEQISAQESMLIHSFH